MTAEVLKFPKEKHNVAFTLLKAATRLEKSSPEGCIALQRRAIALMALELKQARYAAYAAEKALEEVGKAIPISQHGSPETNKEINTKNT